jgi:hypothetical protein
MEYRIKEYLGIREDETYREKVEKINRNEDDSRIFVSRRVEMNGLRVADGDTTPVEKWVDLSTDKCVKFGIHLVEYEWDPGSNIRTINTLELDALFPENI